MTPDLQLSRESIERALEAGDWGRAQADLRELGHGHPTAATAGFVISAWSRLRPHVALVPCRLYVLRSFTVEPVVPLLRAAAFAGGIDLTVKVGGFNAWVQEILDTGGPLGAFAPDVAILAVQTRDAAPELWERFPDLPAARREAAAAEVAAAFRAWMAAFRRHSRAALVVHSLELPEWAGAGVLDAQDAAGQTQLIARINQEIRTAAASIPGVWVLDYDALVARAGRSRWADERKWLTVRLPIRAEHLHALAAEWMRYLHPITGRIAKVLVTDLDNTLWGGVVGEDGIEGIRVGREYPGAAYWELQRVMLDLHRRGVLLAIASKNNPEDAMRALEAHPEMLLRPHHFSAVRVNWNDKAASLREIAAELNVGIDALVFLDDNPAERRRIRMELPEVTVLELPADPLGYARALRECPLFERLAVSGEDGERARYYAEQRGRGELQRAAASLEEFYRSLAQRAEMAPLENATLARAAELTRKTNQFNLTTRRRGEAQLAALAAEPDCEVWTARVADRFGDNGLVALLILRRAGEACEIESLLMSCRVIGRTVETAVLAFAASRARAMGAKRLEGWFIPTAKNAPAAEFYPGHGFQPAAQREDGTFWTLPLEGAALACPPWIELRGPKEPTRSVHVHA